jgi:hypothetical protein
MCHTALAIAIIEWHFICAMRHAPAGSVASFQKDAADARPAVAAKYLLNEPG